MKHLIKHAKILKLNKSIRQDIKSLVTVLQYYYGDDMIIFREGKYWIKRCECGVEGCNSEYSSPIDIQSLLIFLFAICKDMATNFINELETPLDIIMYNKSQIYTQKIIDESLDKNYLSKECINDLINNKVLKVLNN